MEQSYTKTTSFDKQLHTQTHTHTHTHTHAPDKFGTSHILGVLHNHRGTLLDVTFTKRCEIAMIRADASHKVSENFTVFEI